MNSPARRPAPPTTHCWWCRRVRSNNADPAFHRADNAVVEDIARRAAAEAAGRIPVLVAPTVPFGSSDHHLPFGGTMTLKTRRTIACSLN